LEGGNKNIVTSVSIGTQKKKKKGKTKGGGKKILKRARKRAGELKALFKGGIPENLDQARLGFGRKGVDAPVLDQVGLSELRKNILKKKGTVAEPDEAGVTVKTVAKKPP